MAVYKKGFKKQNTEMLLLKTIVVIVATVILAVLIAFVYDATTKWRNYSNYDNVAKYENAFELKGDDGLKLSNYVIYVYSNNNESSKKIKNDVWKVARKLDKNTFYLLNIDTAEGEKDDFLEIIERTSIAVPMLITVTDGKYKELFVG